MHKLTSIIFGALIIISSLSSAPVANAQGPPEISVDCDSSSPSEINVSMDSLRVAVTYCYVENPSSFNEDVDFIYDSNHLSVSGLSSMFITAGTSRVMEVVARASQLQEAGEFPISITATVRKANGAPTWPVSPTDTEEFNVIIVDYTECSLYDYPDSLGVGIDGNVDIEVEVTCYSNVATSLLFDFVLHDVGSVATLNPDPIYWPGGFEDRSPECAIDLIPGPTVFQCSFQAHTSTPLISSIDACVSIFISDQEAPDFCSNKMLLLEPRMIGLSSTGSMGYLVPVLILIAVAVSAFALRGRLDGWGGTGLDSQT